MKTAAHQVYKTKSGLRVPGTTTITGNLGWNKQALITWANNLGLEGIVASKFRDDKAEIGTLAHRFLLDEKKGVKTDTSDYSANQIQQAENSLISYYEWAKGKKIEPILMEEPLVDEENLYGGTPDIYGRVDGVLELTDYKTGKGIYLEHFIQVAGGYKHLLEANGYKVERVRILLTRK